MREGRILRFRVARFVLVGLGNTAVNFMVLNFAFFVLHRRKLTASIIATVCAVVFSFLLNRSFVFNDARHPRTQLIPFLLVTASGALLLQNAVYALCVHWFNHLSHDLLIINLSNLIASGCVMVWNYNGYRWFVFRPDKPREEQHGIENEAA